MAVPSRTVPRVDRDLRWWRTARRRAEDELAELIRCRAQLEALEPALLRTIEVRRRRTDSLLDERLEAAAADRERVEPAPRGSEPSTVVRPSRARGAGVDGGRRSVPSGPTVRNRRGRSRSMPADGDTGRGLVEAVLALASAMRAVEEPPELVLTDDEEKCYEMGVCFGTAGTIAALQAVRLLPADD